MGKVIEILDAPDVSEFAAQIEEVRREMARAVLGSVIPWPEQNVNSYPRKGLAKPFDPLGFEMARNQP